ETLHNVAAGRYALLRLQRRAAQSQPPRLALLDLRTSAVRSGLATPAVLAIERHLAADGQVLVFLNRRGYAPTLLCTACGWIAPCRECDARLTVHLAAGRLRCHHCGADAPLPHRFPRARASRADHRAGGGTRGARRAPRRSADPERIPGSPAAHQPARGRLRRICARGPRGTLTGGLAAVQPPGGAARLGHHGAG